MTRLALASDIHANLPALEAVLADAERLDCTRFFCLGDLVGFGPDPTEVVELLMQRRIPCLAGNVDRNVLRITTRREGYRAKGKWDKFVSYAWTLLQLPDPARQFLSGLPERIEGVIDGTTFCLLHGDPGSADGALEREISDDEAERRLRRTCSSLLVAGHTHVPFVRALAMGVIANCGSVGRPYLGSPVAQYLVVDCGPQIQIEVRSLPFDLERVKRSYQKKGLPQTMADALAAGRSFTPDDQEEIRRWVLTQRPVWLDRLGGHDLHG